MIKRVKNLPLLLVLFLGLSSCSTMKSAETVTQPQPLETAKAKPPVKQRPNFVGPGGDSRELLMPQTDFVPGQEPIPPVIEDSAANEKKPVERKGPLFSLSAQDVEIKTILLALAKEIKQNIVIEPGVTRKVTVDLKDVTLPEALDNLLLPNRLKWTLQGDFIHVVPQKMETRLFRMNYIITRRQGVSNLQATSGQGTASTTSIGASGGGAGNLNTGTAGAGVGGGSGTGSGRTFNNLFTSEETDLWREIFFGLKRLVTDAETQGDRPDITQQGASGGLGASTGIGGVAQSQDAETGSDLGTTDSSDDGATTGPKEKGFFTINRQAGIIVVKDFPDVLIKIAEFLEAVEGSAQRQVFILAKILEVNLRDEFKLGIDWSLVSPVNILHDNEPGVNQQFGDVFNLAKTASSPLGTFIQGSAGFFYGLSNTQLNIMIDALGQQGNVSVLSSPKIATLNNQRAVIKVGTEDVFFIPQVVTASETGTQTTTFIPSSLTIGIVLDVLPQINENGQVMMNINTSISEKSGDRVAPDGRTSIPVLDVRESNNVVLAQSGQTIVIGGLMKNRKSKNQNEVPLLGEIPIVGRLFQHEEDIDAKTELVIMLTPQVMAGKAIDEKLQQEEKRLQNFVLPKG